MADDKVEVGITANTQQAAVNIKDLAAGLDRMKVSAEGAGVGARNIAAALAALTAETQQSVSATLANEQANIRMRQLWAEIAAQEHEAMEELAQYSETVHSMSETTPKEWARGAEALRKNTEETKQLNLATSGAIQEYIRLGHEAMQGNFSRMPGSLVVLTSRFGELNAETFAAMLSIGGLTAVLGGLIYSAVDLAMAINSIHLGAEFAGNMELTKDAISGLMTTMRTTSSLARKDMEEFLGTIARMRGITLPEFNALGMAFQDLAKITGSTKIAQEDVVKLFGEEAVNAKSLAAVFPAITQGQVDTIEKAQQQGNTHERNAAMLRLLKEETARTKDEQVKLDEEVQNSHSWWDILTGKYRAATVRLNEFYTAQVTLQQGIKGAEQHAPELPLVDILTPMEIAQQKIHEEETNWHETRTQMLANEVTFWQQAMGATRDGTKEHQQAINAMLGAEAALYRAKSAESVEAVRNKNALISTNEALMKSEQESQALQNWDILLSGDTLTADQRVDIERSRAQQVASIAAAERAEGLQRRRDIEEDQKEQERARQNDIRIAHAEWEAELQLTNEHNRLEMTAMRQAAAEHRRLDQEESRQKVAQLNELLGYEQNFVNNVLSGRMTMGNALLRLSGQFIERELAQDLRYFTARLFYSDAELAHMYKNGIGGMIFHSEIEGAKTAATAEGAAARTAAEGAGWLASMGMWLTNAIAWITGDAAVATAGATAQAAPYAGPAAPAIGAGVGSFVLGALAMLPALDKGTWNVPQDMTANIHKGEIVVPEPFADKMRSGALGGGGTTIIIQAMDSVDVSRFVKNHAGAISKAVSEHQRFNPDSRPTW